MRVSINGELVVECSHILPERWNGWIVPVFTVEQMEEVKRQCVVLGWVELSDDGVPAHLEGWEDLGDGEWTTAGWVWEVESLFTGANWGE